ncbi:MAG: YitT family protein [Candidatus Coproplasma sp.]
MSEKNFVSNYFKGIRFKREDFKLFNFVMLVIAGIINAIGVTLLLAPLRLYDSGVSGLAMFLDVLIVPMPLWSWLIIINVPIFIFGARKQGAAFTIYSLFGIIIYSLASMLIQNILPAYVSFFVTDGVSPIAGTNLLLAAVFGGILSGVGSGITIRYGGTLDGMETLAVMFSKKLGLTVGNFVMIFNVLLYLTVGIYYRATGAEQYFEIALFSIIAYYVNGKTVDFITEGLDQAKGAIIITTKYDTVAPALSEEFGRGLTVINAKGYYSQSEKQVIYCVVNRFQLARLRAVVTRCDKQAFVTVMNISDVFGTSIKNGRAYEKMRAKKAREAAALAAAEKKALREAQSRAVSEAAATQSDAPVNEAAVTQINNSEAAATQVDEVVNEATQNDKR